MKPRFLSGTATNDTSLFSVRCVNVTISVKLSKSEVTMYDDTLQHHFDEVFKALQDQENFEIFTGMRPTKTPRVKKTLVKIIRPAASSPPAPPPNYSQTTVDMDSMTSTFSVPSKNVRKRSYDTHTETSESQPKSSASITGKLYFLPPREERQKIAARNTLFECKYCGRYVLGDFLTIHEDQCGDESMSYTIH